MEECNLIQYWQETGLGKKEIVYRNHVLESTKSEGYTALISDI